MLSLTTPRPAEALVYPYIRSSEVPEQVQLHRVSTVETPLTNSRANKPPDPKHEHREQPPQPHGGGSSDDLAGTSTPRRHDPDAGLGGAIGSQPAAALCCRAVNHAATDRLSTRPGLGLGLACCPFPASLHDLG